MFKDFLEYMVFYAIIRIGYPELEPEVALVIATLLVIMFRLIEIADFLKNKKEAE